jgi:hypothetical protein
MKLDENTIARRISRSQVVNSSNTGASQNPVPYALAIFTTEFAVQQLS